jgi:hypothetical protein
MIEADLTEQEQKEKTERENAANEKVMAESASVYKRLFATKDGKIILEDLSTVCGQKVASSLPDFDTNRTFFHDGMRNVLLYINQKMNRKDKKENDNG